MLFSINDYISSNEKILWSGMNIYCYYLGRGTSGASTDPSDVIITNKKIICCNTAVIKVIPLSHISFVEGHEVASVIIHNTSADHGDELYLYFKNNDALCKQFLQILLNQIG